MRTKDDEARDPIVAVETDPSSADLCALMREHVGRDATPLRTVIAPVTRSGENWRVHVVVFRERGRPPRRRWYAWILPQQDGSVFFAIPRSRRVRNAGHAVSAGIGHYVCDADA